jgi:hypothetical protein
VTRFDGPVKKVAELREYWCDGPRLPASTEAAGPTYNLAEFSLWQTSPQNRFLVGPGRLATALTSALRLLANERELAARAAGLESPGGEESAKKENQQQEAVRANTIKNYFRPSQSHQPHEWTRYISIYRLTCVWTMRSRYLEIPVVPERVHVGDL